MVYNKIMSIEDNTDSWKDDDQILPEGTNEWEENNIHPVQSPEEIDQWMIETGGDINRYLTNLAINDPEVSEEILKDAQETVGGLMFESAHAKRAREILSKKSQ